MKTPRLTTLFLMILSASNASYAIENQQEEGYYLARVQRDTYSLSSKNERIFEMYIQGSTPLSIIRAYMKKNSLPERVGYAIDFGTRSIYFSSEDEGLSFHQFKAKWSDGDADIDTTSEDQGTSDFPYYPTLKDTLQESQKTYRIKRMEYIYTTVIFTKDASQGDNFETLEIKTKQKADNLLQELFPDNTNESETSNEGNIINNDNQNNKYQKIIIITAAVLIGFLVAVFFFFKKKAKLDLAENKRVK